MPDLEPLVSKPVVFVGYPKAASTYVENYLHAHPSVQVDRIKVPNVCLPAEPRKPVTDGKVQVCVNEKIAESVIFLDRNVVDKRTMFTPGSWEAVSKDICYDPHEMARRIEANCTHSRILMVVREQSDWLSTAYRYFLPRLPSDRRSFSDFCSTPRGMAYLEAGHYDRTIRAYGDRFGWDNLCVVRFEQLREDRDKFVDTICRFLGVEAFAAPSAAANQSSTVAVSKLRRSLPILERIPAPLRVRLRVIANMLPIGGTTMLPAEMKVTLQAFYASSNRRTDELLQKIADANNDIPR